MRRPGRRGSSGRGPSSEPSAAASRAPSRARAPARVETCAGRSGRAGRVAGEVGGVDVAALGVGDRRDTGGVGRGRSGRRLQAVEADQRPARRVGERSWPRSGRSAARCTSPARGRRRGTSRSSRRQARRGRAGRGRPGPGRGRAAPIGSGGRATAPAGRRDREGRPGGRGVERQEVRHSGCRGFDRLRDRRRTWPSSNAVAGRGSRPGPHAPQGRVHRYGSEP